MGERDEMDKLDDIRDRATPARVEGVRDLDQPAPPPKLKGAALSSVVADNSPFTAVKFADGRTVEAFPLKSDVTIDLNGPCEGHAGEVVVRYGGDVPDVIMTAECFNALVGKP